MYLTVDFSFWSAQGLTNTSCQKSDKKVKLYYLTDLGIDLFPILYEMIYWSKRNLDQEFHPLSKDWFKWNETFTPEEIILENQNDYKSKREKLLEVQ